jgi:hypothetical protein
VATDDPVREALEAAGIPFSEAELAHLRGACTAIRARAARVHQPVVDAEEPADVYSAGWDGLT